MGLTSAPHPSICYLSPGSSNCIREHTVLVPAPAKTFLGVEAVNVQVTEKLDREGMVLNCSFCHG